MDTLMFHAAGSSGAEDPTGPTPINHPGKTTSEIAHVTTLVLSTQSFYMTGAMRRVDRSANA